MQPEQEENTAPAPEAGTAPAVVADEAKNSTSTMPNVKEHNIPSKFSKLKVAELRTQLQEAGLPVDGNKADLIARCDEHLTTPTNNTETNAKKDASTHIEEDTRAANVSADADTAAVLSCAEEKAEEFKKLARLFREGKLHLHDAGSGDPTIEVLGEAAVPKQDPAPATTDGAAFAVKKESGVVKHTRQETAPIV